MRGKIEWTDRTWNPVTGCSKVSPGCAHCYAETVAKRFWAKQYPPVEYLDRIEGDGYPKERTVTRPRQFTDVMTHADRLDRPLRWQKASRIFVNSMSDLFHEDVPDGFIDQVFAVMALAPQHTFVVITKRAERMSQYFGHHEDEPLDLRERIDDAAGNFDACHANLDTPGRWPLPNVWLGVSVENQHFADERIPLLLQTPAAVRFLSAEPLLGPVDIGLPFASDNPYMTQRHVDWVIVGGESGQKARPCDVAWVRSIVRSCKSAGVPVFVKQLGSHVIDRNDAGFEGDPDDSWTPETRCEDLTSQGWQGDPVRIRLRNRKGGDPAEWPEDLRVREFP